MSIYGFNSPEILSDQRDRSILKFLLPPRTMPHGLPPLNQIDEVRIAVLWGIDRNQLIIACLASLYVRDRDTLERIVAVREERGRIEFWCRAGTNFTDPTARDVQRALADAVEAVMFSRWKVTGGVALPCKAGETVIDWEQLPEGDPLRGVARSYGLGLHVNSGAK
jgi:hypothetical protein